MPCQHTTYIPLHAIIASWRLRRSPWTAITLPSEASVSIHLNLWSLLHLWFFWAVTIAAFGLTASCAHYFNQTWHLYSSNHFLKRHQQGSLCPCLTEKVCMAMWLDKQTTATHSLNIAINQTGKIFIAAAKMQWMFFPESKQRWEKEEFTACILAWSKTFRGFSLLKEYIPKWSLNCLKGRRMQILKRAFQPIPNLHNVSN